MGEIPPGLGLVLLAVAVLTRAPLEFDAVLPTEYLAVVAVLLGTTGLGLAVASAVWQITRRCSRKQQEKAA
ncbi:hypothetical protein GCM10027404_20500 [Arthrobacter tumbae]|nr:hypothetical protein [Arthrobacter tumbae]